MAWAKGCFARPSIQRLSYMILMISYDTYGLPCKENPTSPTESTEVTKDLRYLLVSEILRGCGGIGIAQALLNLNMTKQLPSDVSLQVFPRYRYPTVEALAPMIGDPCRGSTWGSQSPWQC